MLILVSSDDAKTTFSSAANYGVRSASDTPVCVWDAIARAPPGFAQRAAQPFQQEEEEKEKERTAEEKEETQQSGNREEASHSARDVPGGL